MMMSADLVKRVVEACGWRAEGELGEGVVRLMGRRRTGRFETRGTVQRGAWKVRWRKMDSCLLTSQPKQEDFYWLE